MERERVELTFKQCDLAKVVMMILVILTHCFALWSKNGWFVCAPPSHLPVVGFLSDWFGSFHTYVFAFLSGYLFFYSKYEKGSYSVYTKAIVKRTKRLLVPYVIVASIWIVPFYCRYYNPTLSQLLEAFVLMRTPSQLWFVVMLYVLFIAALFLTDHLPQNQIASWLIMGAIYVIVGILGSRITRNYFQINQAALYLPFFYWGMSVRKGNGSVLWRINPVLWTGVSLLVFSVLYFGLSQSTLISKLMKYIAKPVCAYIGVNMVMSLTCRVSDGSKIYVAKVYRFLKKHNYVMYMLHQQIIWYVIMNYSATGNGTSMKLILLCVLASFGGSGLLSFILSKVPLINRLMGLEGEH